MHILITGGTGMIGRHLIPALQAQGHQVTVVTRSPSGPGQISWEDPFPPVDAAIHLAGARVVGQRWTSAYLRELYHSRAATAATLRSRLTERCRVVITASGANCYAHGTFSSPPATESDPVTSAHELGRMCQAWEAPWQGFCARVVALRIGFVISPDDSGVQTMLPIYRMGLGGVIGSGQQRMGWISIHDLVRIFLLALTDDRLSGPINAVSPQVITFSHFNDAFARAVGMPAFWRIPAWAIRIPFGRLADEMILPDAPVAPLRLQQLGFTWEVPTIHEALQLALGS